MAKQGRASKLWADDIIRWTTIIIVVSLVLNVGVYYYTQFEKSVNIKDKYVRYRRGGSAYHVVADDGNIYQIGNVWFKGDFNRAEDYNRLEKGKTYNVKGYGYRWGMFDSYQKIYEIMQ